MWVVVLWHTAFGGHEAKAKAQSPKPEAGAARGASPGSRLIDIQKHGHGTETEMREATFSLAYLRLCNLAIDFVRVAWQGRTRRRLLMFAFD